MMFDHPADRLPPNLFMLLFILQSLPCGVSSANRGRHA
jgi:hypothetical protein